MLYALMPCLLVIELFPRIVAASRSLNGSLLSHLPIARSKKILKKFYFLVVSSIVYVYTLIRCTKHGASVVVVAQSVVAPDCGSGGREFKSRQPPQQAPRFRSWSFLLTPPI